MGQGFNFQAAKLKVYSISQCCPIDHYAHFTDFNRTKESVKDLNQHSDIAKYIEQQTGVNIEAIAVFKYEEIICGANYFIRLM